MTRETMFRPLAVAALVVLLALAASAHAQAPAQTPSQMPPHPFAPDWGMIAGWDVFSKKGCGQCHSIRGAGGKEGPDLARLGPGQGFFDLGAALWNHLPRMGARMRGAGIDRPTLTPTEMGNLLAFLFTAQYWDAQGDPRTGEQVFAAKGCVQCHAVGGAGGQVGPALDAMRQANSPVLVAAAMWNHAPKMTDVMRGRGTVWPRFQDRELIDLITYVVAVSKDTPATTRQIIPGTPERGRELFSEKKCASCHAVAGKGPRVGPDLGTPGRPLSLTQFAGQMWNHAPGMLAKMKERNVEPPALTGQDMADLLAYLYVSRYFDTSGRAERGREALQAKGCLGCHSVGGKGGTAGADFTSSNVVKTPSSIVAGMWNHSRLMEAETQKRQVAWPTVTGRELADITAYLTSLGSRPGGAKPPAR